MKPGDWLRERRRLAGLTQEQAADRALLSQGTWSRIERGRWDEPWLLRHAGRLAAAVGADHHELVELMLPWGNTR